MTYADLEPRGSGIATVGGEAPLEQTPEEKFCVEKDVPLCRSIMWKMLDKYYKQMAIQAWSHDYVPSFVTSNSRLCRSYAKIIVNFLQDWFKKPEADPAKPVVVIEIGGGHGRFTFLVLRALQRYQPMFARLGLPEKPFLYVFSDVAEANVAFCSSHPCLKEFVEKGWLDFAIFDGNVDTEIYLEDSKQKLKNGDAPLIAICNYVLDSLLTDAWRISPKENPEFERALVSVYSPRVEADLSDPSIMLRMTLGWGWRGVDLKSLTSGTSVNSVQSNDTSAAVEDEYLLRDPCIVEVLHRYRSLDKPLSFVLPIGAFSLFQNLREIGGGRLFVLVGDKGYPAADEFVGSRDPHIAIHGSISFMLNLHAVRLYFECLGGFSHATPYRDAFQVTGLWLCGEEEGMGRSVCAFLEEIEDLAPDALINWQRAAQETVAAGGGPCTGIKPLLSLLRYSCHDPDVFLNFQSEFISQSMQPYLNPRTEKDIITDLDAVFKNWFKLKKDEDVAEVCAHICMKLGRCDKALPYLKASIASAPEGEASVSSLVNLASCYKVQGLFHEGLACINDALEKLPNFTQALAMKQTLEMCLQPVEMAVIGAGYWSTYEAIHLLRRDPRFKISSVYSLKAHAAEEFVSKLNEREGGLDAPKVYKGSSGLQQILGNDNIKALILDVHPQLLLSLLPRVLAARKHVLVRSPLHITVDGGFSIIKLYQPFSNDLIFHAVENNRNEDAFEEANERIKSLGAVSSFTIKCITDTALDKDFSTEPFDLQTHLAVELVRCITAVSKITGLHLNSLAAAATGDYAPCVTNSSESRNSSSETRSSSSIDTVTHRSNKSACNSREFARLTGWITMKATQSRSILGTFVVSHCAGDNLLQFVICCDKGIMKLSKTASCWRVETVDEKGNTNSCGFPSIGHQNCHDAFASALYAKLHQKSGAEFNEDGYVDISVDHALSDSAVVAGVLASIQEKGAVVRYPTVVL